MQSIDELLKALALEHYASIFTDNEVDFRTLLVLTDTDLEQLTDHRKRKLPFGPRKLLLNALAELRARGGAPAAASAASPTAASGGPAAGERRQLTVLFSDMVGSTSLSARLDPEVLQTINRRYEEACAAAVEFYEGKVFQGLGDGIVAFFGYPEAHEADADRAIRAALRIIESVSALALPHGERVQVRIGITTGLVVVDADGKRAVGEALTLNLAARLQSIAEPGSVVVSDRVRRLTGGSFQYEDLGQHELKGIPETTRVWRVRGLGVAASRFDAATEQGLTPLVGRRREIGRLLERWNLAKEGTGQAVLVSGEPGIGKSRVLRELRETLEAQGAGVLTFQCSPYHGNSAFYPSIDNFERTLKFDRDTPAATRLERLEAFMKDRYGRPPEDVLLIASLLSIPFEERYGRLDVTPQRHKEQTIQALVGLIEARARQQPSLMLVEDVHWADPSTLESLDTLIGCLSDFPLLLVISHRPEFDRPWPAGGRAVPLRLSKLTPAQSVAMISRLTGGRAMPAGIREQITLKTAGVPLWVEELTRSILDELEEKSHTGGPARVTIPRTLHGSLQARLDSIHRTAREIAQVGAVVGREFSHELISAVTPLSAAALDDGLARLTESGLALRRRTGAQTVYVFKHALVRDVAYDSLFKSRRQELHGRIARVLEERFPASGETEPELLAWHYTEAGLDDKAVALWRRAGAVSMKRFALPEAIAHLRKGLALVHGVRGGRERDLEELALRTQLAPAVVAAHGWAAPEVGDLLEPAWRLAESLNHTESYLPILHGLWVHFLTVGKLDVSVGWAEQMRAAAETCRDPDLEINAERSLMASRFWLGDLAAARRHADAILSMYDPQRHWHIADRTNNDPRTMVGIYGSHFLWMLGYPERAMRECDAKDDHARRRNHPFDLGFALTLGSHAYDYCGRPDRLLLRVEEAERLGRERGVTLMSEIMAQIVKGIAWLRAGRTAESIDQLRGSIDGLRTTGHRIYVTYLRAVLADAVARVGGHEEGLRLIDESLEQIDRQGEKVHLAEVQRLKGWMLHRQGRLDAAEEILRAALDGAREQQAKSWELRVTMTLGRLLGQRGRAAEAYNRLSSIHDWFTEGHDTPDLLEAKTLLAELSRATTTEESA